MARKEEKGRKLGSSVHRSVCALSPTSRPPEQPIYDILGHGEVKVGGKGKEKGSPSLNLLLKRNEPRRKEIGLKGRIRGR